LEQRHDPSLDVEAAMVAPNGDFHLALTSVHIIF